MKKLVDPRPYIRRGTQGTYHTSFATRPSNVECQTKAPQSGKPLKQTQKDRKVGNHLNQQNQRDRIEKVERQEYLRINSWKLQEARRETFGDQRTRKPQNKFRIQSQERTSNSRPRKGQPSEFQRELSETLRIHQMRKLDESRERTPEIYVDSKRNLRNGQTTRRANQV